MKKGRLFVLSGPSGTGKGTICKKILHHVDANLSVSMTTRKPRAGETEGESYYFVDDKEFLSVLEEDGFLEHMEVYGSLYGTPKGPVLDALNKGKDVILEIDIQGALKVKESFPDGVFIFILPPSLKELEERLIKRGTEDKENIELRLSETINELSHIDKYEYYVVNDSVEDAASAIISIMKAEHSKVDDDTVMIVEEIIKEK